jgi:hypothetical protein
MTQINVLRGTCDIRRLCRQSERAEATVMDCHNYIFTAESCRCHIQLGGQQAHVVGQGLLYRFEVGSNRTSTGLLMGLLGARADCIGVLHVETATYDQTVFFEALLEAQCGTFGEWDIAERIPAGKARRAKGSMGQGMNYTVT